MPGLKKALLADVTCENMTTLIEQSLTHKTPVTVTAQGRELSITFYEMTSKKSFATGITTDGQLVCINLLSTRNPNARILLIRT